VLFRRGFLPLLEQSDHALGDERCRAQSSGMCAIPKRSGGYATKRCVMLFDERGELR
jgi:hypothetical protein